MRIVNVYIKKDVTKASHYVNVPKYGFSVTRISYLYGSIRVRKNPSYDIFCAVFH